MTEHVKCRYCGCSLHAKPNDKSTDAVWARLAAHVEDAHPEDFKRLQDWLDRKE